MTGKKDGRAGRYTTSEDENPYLIDKFEWFYSPIADRWGLRRLEDGTVQIEPKFHSVQVEKGLNFSLVGIEKPGRYEFERTTYRFESIYGLVNNEVGLLVTEVAFWDVQFEDFRNGNPLARCIFDTGKYGLVNRIGQIVKRDCAFVGPFSDGLAVISMQWAPFRQPEDGEQPRKIIPSPQRNAVAQLHERLYQLRSDFSK